jgi:UDP-N-acetylglucosamine--N-acetylmuramyl-(pentapeptide) pyrophosphoryl-undecaprenol N-acetylglucosamine transferase
MSKKLKILFGAGGTGGHAFPAWATIGQCKEEGHECAFVTDKRAEKYDGGIDDVPVHVIRSGTPFSKNPFKIAKGFNEIRAGVQESMKLLEQEKPDAVLVFGGYPPFPLAVAAKIKGIPLVLHEQNGVLGKANKWLARMANAIASSVPQLKGLSKKMELRTTFTGNPVRDNIVALRDKPYPEIKEDSDLNILITGGSQGAAVLSKVLPQAFAGLSPEHLKRIRVKQQCHKDFYESTRQDYKGTGVNVELTKFIPNMAEEIEKSHLFIGRSGASTVTEQVVAGRPSIFVPYPNHKDQQQKLNAEFVVEAGGAWMILQDSFTPEAVREKIEEFLKNPEVLKTAAANARACGKPDAVHNLSKLVIDIAMAPK